MKRSNYEHVVFTRNKYPKRVRKNRFGIVLLILVLVFSFTIVTAPTLTEEVRGEKRKYAEKKIEEWRLEKEFIRYSQHLGSKESGNDPDIINKIGCFGEWQFKESTLHDLGYTDITLKKFKKDPSSFPREMQFEALKDFTNYNTRVLSDCERFIGTTVYGILVTKSGMLGAAHLGGSDGIRKFLVTGGKTNRGDIFGTTIATYLKEFQGYDL